jgi:hypothetical protein
VNLKKISIELSIDDVKEILRIVLDEEPEDALKFIKNNLLKQVQAALQPR